MDEAVGSGAVHRAMVAFAIFAKYLRLYIDRLLEICDGLSGGFIIFNNMHTIRQTPNVRLFIYLANNKSHNLCPSSVLTKQRQSPLTPSNPHRLCPAIPTFLQHHHPPSNHSICIQPPNYPPPATKKQITSKTNTSQDHSQCTYHSAWEVFLVAASSVVGSWSLVYFG